ncbi:response regulator [Paenibacillus puldeungensis]|uniref:Response regulator n=1 Tax=Paenibacillus puldeungensis TaxID=696536 RepID=A0ABW3RZS4_9BACL
MQLHHAMLVDDEVFSRKGLMKLIDWETCGFRIVAEADNGEDALELIRRLKPDLVITDIRMPVLDGLELIRQTTRSEEEGPEFIIISGYDDFKYAQQAVRYGVHDFVLKPIDQTEFADTLRRLHGKLSQRQEARAREERLQGGAVIESILKGDADEGAIAGWEERLNLKAVNELFYMLVELNDHHPWREKAEDITPSRFMELVQAALERLAGDGQTFPLREHRNRLGLIVPDRALAPLGDSIRSFAERLLRELEVLDGRVFVYAGGPVSRLTELREAYQAAREALQYKYICDDSGIVLSAEASLQPIQYLAIDQGLYGRIIEQVEELQLDRLEDSIRAMFRDFQEKRYAPEAVKMNLHQCVLGIVQIVRRMDGDEQSLRFLAPMMGWPDLNLTLREIKRLFASFAVESSRYIAELRRERQRGDIHKIRSYIETHYQDNITLKSIASRFYMNPVYLGQLFKKHYSIYFNDFLLQLRVNEAKRLLRQTDLRVYEVAERVGFGNPDYFVTQFEKLEKVTPSEYRSRLLREGTSGPREEKKR